MTVGRYEDREPDRSESFGEDGEPLSEAGRCFLQPQVGKLCFTDEEHETRFRRPARRKNRPPGPPPPSGSGAEYVGGTGGTSYTRPHADVVPGDH